MYTLCPWNLTISIYPKLFFFFIKRRFYWFEMDVFNIIYFKFFCRYLKWLSVCWPTLPNKWLQNRWHAVLDHIMPLLCQHPNSRCMPIKLAHAKSLVLDGMVCQCMRIVLIFHSQLSGTGKTVPRFWLVFTSFKTQIFINEDKTTTKIPKSRHLDYLEGHALPSNTKSFHFDPFD